MVALLFLRQRHFVFAFVVVRFRVRYNATRPNGVNVLMELMVSYPLYYSGS